MIAPSGSLIDKVEIRIYRQQGRVESLLTGYQAAHEFMLHYGKKIRLDSGEKVQVLVRFESPYYASEPSITLSSESDYLQLVLQENTLTLAAFGALIALALYNLFIFEITRDRAHLYYALYLFCYFVAWALTFHLPAELFGWHELRWHYLPFFLLPVFNTLFYIEFLQLKKNFPRLAVASRVNFVLPLLLLPSCYFALSLAHTLATIVIGIWLMLALCCGVVCMRAGFRPAGYFVLAFVALLVPAMLILPANLGLIPDLVDNSELLTLLGGTLDALLLAFALAYKIKLLQTEKNAALEQTNRTLAMAHTDHLTGIANRQAFDLAVKAVFRTYANASDGSALMLLLLDLDGLKALNDQAGHLQGDRLLRSLADALKALEQQGLTVYRLGGDEFTILAQQAHEAKLHQDLARIERELREAGFAMAGISYGCAYASQSHTITEMLRQADAAMYRHKLSRRINQRS